QSIQTTNFINLEERAKNAPDTVFVINFWATWCAPCLKELPYFEQLAEKYKDKPLKVILLSLDFKSKIQSDLVPFVKKQGIKS
ncbi:redoxin, partial [Enterococcus faecium]|uniref:TlpA disulfide reductase family protein n=1 Tax=Enterococcus faecium TaxID=1352 RepID=UPI001025A74D